MREQPYDDLSLFDQSGSRGRTVAPSSQVILTGHSLGGGLAGSLRGSVL